MNAPRSSGERFAVDLMHEEQDGSRWGYRLRRVFNDRGTAERAALRCRWMERSDGERVPVTEATVAPTHR